MFSTRTLAKPPRGDNDDLLLDEPDQEDVEADSEEAFERERDDD